jgi:hypothetical protein
MRYLLPLVLLCGIAAWAATADMLQAPNLKAMGCAAPDTKYVFAGGSQPGNVFFPREPVQISVKIGDPVRPASLTFSVIEVTNRGDKYLDGWADMTPPFAVENLGVRGTVTVPVPPVPTGKEAPLTVTLPVPDRYGCYAVTVAPGGKNPQFLCSLLRAMKPVDGYTTGGPFVGEAGQFLGGDWRQVEQKRQRMLGLSRLGVRLVRFEWGGMANDFRNGDVIMRVLEEAKIKAMVTLGAHPYHTMPLGEPTPAPSPWKPDHTAMPKYDDAFGKWVFDFCMRYWKGGDGALWGIEHWNEPWEPVSISGWESDSRRYRQLFAQLADNAHKVDPRIKACAACSIMNTEDKFLTGEDAAEWARRIDAFTDHYVAPRTSYGPMVAKYWGKESFETETWGGATEMLLAQLTLQYQANGQTRINPWTGNMIYFHTPGAGEFTMPNPTALGTNVLSVMLTDRPFQRLLFLDRLPFAFQFGTGDQALVVLTGRLLARLSFFGAPDIKDVLWGQFNLAPGGTITIDNRDGKLQFRDAAGNPEGGKGMVTFPLDYLPHYITAKGGVETIRARLAAAKIEQARPVEIVAHDFPAPLARGVRTTVKVHNLLNRRIDGTLTVTPPAGVTLAATAFPLTLDAGATATIAAVVDAATLSPSNVYPFTFRFTGPAGTAEWSEALNVTVAKRGTKTIDGKLDDWTADLSVPVRATATKADATAQVWLPFLEHKDKAPDGSFAEVKLAWDDNNLYVAARVNDPTPSLHGRLAAWDEDSFFHSAADDAVCETLRPYEKFVTKYPNPWDGAANTAFQALKKDPDWPAYEKFLAENPAAKQAAENFTARQYFLAKRRNPKASYAEATYVYKREFGMDAPYRGDTFQFALDPLPGYAHHRLVPDTDRVPEFFHAMPDTDYEFGLYACTDGGSELWRLLAPGVPRGHHFPHQARSKIDQGPVPGQHAVKRDGTVTIYEAAIPWTELLAWQPVAGSTFGFTFRVNNDKGPGLAYGEDKSATKHNGLTLHPYWESKPSCGIRWMLGG